MKLSGSALPVPQLMARLRSVAVDATIRVGRESSTSQGLLATSAKPKRLVIRSESVLSVVSLAITRTNVSRNMVTQVATHELLRIRLPMLQH